MEASRVFWWAARRERSRESPERRSDGFASFEVNGSFRHSTCIQLNETFGNWLARTLYVRECEQKSTFKTRTYNVRAIRGVQECAAEFEKTCTRSKLTTHSVIRFQDSLAQTTRRGPPMCLETRVGDSSS